MTIQVPPAAYAAYARGEISEAELLGLEKTASELNKSAATGFDPLSVRGAATLGGLALAAPALTYAGAAVPKAIDSTMGALTFNRDLRRVVEVNPQLGDASDPNLRMAFKTLRSVNPDYSKDPLIAGTILDMVMTNRMDPDDPTSAPRFDPALLQSIQLRGGKSALEVATDQGKAAIPGLTRGLIGD